MNQIMAEAGWFGSRHELLATLAAAGADRNEEGNFLIFGEPIAAGLDPDEVVVPPRARYRANGQEHSLADLLNSTTYGVAVTII